MPRDPRCVFIADNPIHAACVIDWLEQHGIQAESPEQRSPGELEVMLFGSRGFEIWVVNPDDAQKAVGLLAEREMARVARQAANDISDETISVVCEECGQVSTFPTQARGSCQLCSHCNAYVDVDDEEDGVAEEIEKPPRSEGIQRPSHLRGEEPGTRQEPRTE